MNENGHELSALPKLLDSWKKQVHNHHQAHVTAARQLRRNHFIIGVPTTILAAIVGANYFSELSEDPNFKTLAGMVGLLVASLSAIQTFYSHAGRSELHRTVAAKLAGIRRTIEILETFQPRSKEQMKEELLKIKNSLDEVENEAPLIISKDSKPPTVPPATEFRPAVYSISEVIFKVFFSNCLVEILILVGPLIVLVIFSLVSVQLMVRPSYPFPTPIPTPTPDAPSTGLPLLILFVALLLIVAYPLLRMLRKSEPIDAIHEKETTDNVGYEGEAIESEDALLQDALREIEQSS